MGFALNRKINIKKVTKKQLVKYFMHSGLSRVLD